MRKVLSAFCYLIFLLSFTSCDEAGPFGLSKGMTLDQIDENALQINPGVYVTLKVPNPHTSFKKYVLVIGPTDGLCKIKAVGKTITTDSFGDQLRKEFEKMRERLEKIYGKGETEDFVKSGNNEKDPEHFIMDLMNKDRILETVWQDKEGSKFKNDIVFVLLRVLPTKSDKASLVLEYEFEGFDSCMEEINRKYDL